MDFDHEDTRRKLIATRTRHGANSPIGHRCSNLIKQMESFPQVPPDGQAALRWFIPHTLASLSKLVAEAR